MTYFADLAPYDYSPEAEPGWVAVGWLERGKEYEIGEVSPRIMEDLTNLAYLGEGQTRGRHYCDLCDEPAEHWARSPRFSSRFRLGSAEIRVTREGGGVYAAPDLLPHYIEEHLYCPPQEFLDAVLAESARRWG
ncbi:hypothetical protein GCM10010275_55210 [Streptomyces litmocidini]|uniref:DUF7919 family protein n=1 Tax=Streptomyces litmocidini TaxID=67318 RepID=UPI00167D5864|nr:hypothetical protein [Streptomyces litmocidini]GGV07873.1 hypothetical protein GCM10010275_55210 [Streptomyces litmocidini]